MFDLGFHQAVPEDACVLTEIALLSKAHWQYSQHWLEAWQPQLTITPEFIAQHLTIKASLETRTAGFYALSRTAPASDLLHFWLLPDFIGQGLGRRIFLDVVARAGAAGITTLRIESDPNAEGFYRRMGCLPAGSSISTMDGQRRELPVLHYSISGPP